MGLIRFFLVALFILTTGQAMACTGACSDAGAVQFCTGTLRYCNGTAWTDLPSETASGTCGIDGVVEYASNELKFCTSTAYKYPYCQSSPTTDGACSLGGTIEYDAVNTRMEFCNGTNWIQMVACGGGGGAPAGIQAFCWGLDSGNALGDSGGLISQTEPVEVETTIIGGFTAINGDNIHMNAITNTGQIVGWGNGSNGENGDAANGTSVTPITLTPPSGVTSWTMVDSGAGPVCGLADTGQIYCWGTGSSGEMGYGTTVAINSTPITAVTLPSGVTSWTSVSAGGTTVCALANTGGAYCWGSDSNGQLGNGATTTGNQSTPVPVTNPSGVTSWTHISVVGTSTNPFTCGIGNDGNAYCWGSDATGQLGNGAVLTADQTTPSLITPPSGVTSWSFIGTASANACAIANTGNMYCWGTDNAGTIGNGATTTADQAAPVIVTNPSGVTSWQSVVGSRINNVGSAHLCGLANNNEIYCWGSDASGQLGNGAGTTGNQTTPFIVTKPSGVTSWNGVAGLQQAACGLGNDNQIYCWGIDTSGKLGNGPDITADQVSPAAIEIPNIAGWVTLSEVTSGGTTSNGCGITDTGKAYCWGLNDGAIGALGNGAVATNSGSPSRVVLPAAVTTWTSITVGSQYACAIANTNNAYCWGRDTNGQLGDDGALTNQTSPTIVSNPSGVTSWTDISAGSSHTCGIGNNGNAYCWGSDGSGRLGNGAGTTTDQPTPSLVTLPSGVTSWSVISAGDTHSCGIGNNGNAYCWGSDGNGQLGNGGANTNVDTPTLVTPLPSGVTSWTTITATANGGCALGNNAQAYCWGLGTNGAIGNGSTTAQTSPTLVSLPSGVTSWTTISARAATNVCAIANTNDLYCWGSDTSGQIGNGTTTTTQQNSPVIVTKPAGLATWSGVSVGSSFVCGIGD